MNTEAKKLEAENEELRKEVFRLKQQLILEEIRNGGISYICVLITLHREPLFSRTVSSSQGHYSHEKTSTSSSCDGNSSHLQGHTHP